MDKVDQTGIDQATSQFQTYIDEVNDTYGKSPTVSSYIGNVSVLNPHVLSNITTLVTGDWSEEFWVKDTGLPKI